MTTKEIDAEIQRLKDLRYELEKQEISEFKEKAKGNVGRCFIVNGQYVKVIDIPTEKHQVSGSPIFNRYQYPALFLGYDIDEDPIIPFYYNTLFSGVWGDGHNMIQPQVTEITQAEFNQKFEQLLQQFKKKYGLRIN